MFDIKQDIQAMTTFRRNPGEFIKRLKKTKRPLILTVNGKEVVVQDAEAYQRLLDIAAQADPVEGIRQGLEDVKRGRVCPARDALEIFRQEGLRILEASYLRRKKQGIIGFGKFRSS
jgi:prevent-host-death family protein